MGILLVGGFLGAQAAMRRFPFSSAGEAVDARLAIVHCVLLAYLIGAYRYVTAGARAAFVALRPYLDMGAGQFDAVLAQVGRYPAAALAPIAAVGVAFAVAGPWLSGPTDVYWLPATWTPEVAWHRVLGLAIGWGIGWMGYALVMESVRLSRLAPSLRPLSLWDTRALAPFTRQGLRNALVAVGLVSVAALFVTEQGVTRAFLLIFVVSLGLATAGFLLPLGGARGIVRQAKQRELEWAAALIGKERRALGEGGSGGGRLADAVTYHQAVERVREWPFDHSAVLRIMLYLLVPLASWLLSNTAAALLDRILFGGS